MHRDRTSFLLLVIFTLATALSTRCAWAASVSDWNKRPGTVLYTKALTDGTHVALDAVIVEKIRAKQSAKYFTVHECFSPTDKLVIMSPPDPRLRLGETIDIEGIVWTLANGQRAITNATVTGYCDKTGKLLVHGGPLIKGLMTPTPWLYKVDLTVQSDSQSPVTSTSPEPNITPPTRPVHYNTIHDATHQVRIQSYGDFVSMADFVCRPVASASSGGYFMMGEDGSQDTLKVYYTGTVSTSQRICRVVGQLREDTGAVQVLCVDSGPGYDPQDGEGGLTLAEPGTIAFAKTLPDNASITLGTTQTGKIVTCALSSNTLYIEEDDRSSGIRIEKTSHGRLAGDRAYIVGTMGTAANGERCINATTADHAGDGLLRPLGKNNRSLGGGDFFYEQSTGKGQRGITGASGLSNIALLVRTWGRVTSKDTANPPTWLTIDDGSSVGVKVDLQTSTGNIIATSVQVNDYIYAAGISSCEVSGSDLVRVLRPGPVTQPTFDPAADLYCTCQGVTAKTTMLGDIVRYTISGTDPDANSTVYDPEGVMVISPNPSMTLKARVYRDAWVTAGTVASAYYYRNSSCDPGTPQPYTCWDYADGQAPNIADLRLTEIAPGMMHLDWANSPVYGGFDVQRDSLTPVYRGQANYTDNFSFTLGTSYLYKVRSCAFTESPPGLPQHGPNDGVQGTHIIQQVPRCTVGQWKEISVTPQKLDVSEDQTVDSREDTRCVATKYVDFKFGGRVYRGGLFVGNAGDPSNRARSLLKFDLASLPGQMGTNDRFWTGNLEAYYTRSFTDEMSTNVGYQWVPNDSWTAQSVVWTTAPAIDPTKAEGYRSVTGSTSSWYNWNEAFSDFVHEKYSGNQVLSAVLASESESSPGWAYFAKKDYDANLAPHMLYAYGKYEDGGAGVPPLFVAGIRLASDHVTGGNTVHGSFVLNGPAPANGTYVHLSTNTCAAWPSDPIFVPEGAVSGDFIVSTAIVSQVTSTEISAFCATTRPVTTNLRIDP